MGWGVMRSTHTHLEIRHEEFQYLDLLGDILNYGSDRDDRTGVGTKSLFGYQMRWDISERFPLLTTKKLHWKSIVHELLWFLKGDMNVKYLNENGVNIWNEWADDKGRLGPIYGEQWRRWGNDWYYQNEGIDQIKDAIREIQVNPHSRRIVVSAWNVEDLPMMKLPPCHVLFQFYVDKGKLSCHLYQRSADAFLGLPFNIASYSLLTYLVSHVTNLQPGEFIHSIGDVHIYNNHVKQVLEQLGRDPKPFPTVKLSPGIADIDKFMAGDVVLLDYDAHPHISGEIAV